MSQLPRRIFNTQAIASGDMSGSLTSSSLDISEVKDISIQAIWSAGSSPVGTIFVKVSNDGSTFTNYDAGQAVSGNSGSVIWNIPNIAYAYLQVIYTRSSGSGTLNAYVNAKR